MPRDEIHAIIGVVRRGRETLYVKRSPFMDTYPDVWSLLSGRATAAEMREFYDPVTVQPYVDRLSSQRLQKTPVRVAKFLSSAYCDKSDHRLFLYMYEFVCDGLPALNPRYYVDARFMSPEEYQEASRGAMCGMCLSMWSRYCVRHGLVDEPFAEANELSPQGDLYVS